MFLQINITRTLKKEVTTIQNEGKRFEDCFSKSAPDYALVKRLNDNAASWSGGNNVRFASDNEGDFIFFDSKHRRFLGLELKSIKDKSLTFWRNDFETKGKKKSFKIRKCQILGLSKWSKYEYCTCGFVINFRSVSNRTFFVNIKDFLDYTENLNKKSINFEDVLHMNPIEIENTLLRTNYRYDVDKFLSDVDGGGLYDNR